MRVQDYWDLLGMKKGMWRWPQEHFEEDAAGVFALRIKDYAGGGFRDVLCRPLGLLTLRLLWEMGELSHEVDGDKEALKAEFVCGDEVALKWSIETPWAMTDLGVGDVDEFFSEAMARGDGSLKVRAIQDEDLEILGTSLRRSFDAAWRSSAGDGNQALGVGVTGPTGELAFAWRQDDVLKIFPCGGPLFGPLDGVDDVKEVRFPGPVAQGVLPTVVSYVDALGQERRGFFPGSEMGAQFELVGHVSLTAEGLAPLCRAFGDSAPCLRVHLGYTPGWHLVPYGLGSGLVCWSELPEEIRASMKEESAQILVV